MQTSVSYSKFDTIWLLALIFLAISTLTRLALALNIGLDQVPLGLWPWVFALGLWFDSATLAWIIAPLLLLARRRDCRQLTRRRMQLRLLAFFLTTTLLLFLALSEWIFWAEFSTRFNFIAVDYLIYTHEVLGNIRESYPVAAMLAGIMVLAALLVWTLQQRITIPTSSLRDTPRLVTVVFAIALPLMSWYWIDIDQMKFSANALANELAGNGLLTFVAALRRNELDYDRFYRTMPLAKASKVLKRLGVERNHSDDEDVEVTHLPLSRAPQNIVLITVESLSADYLGVFGNNQSLTPRLDELSQNGLLFTKFYATGTRTVRGLEALSLGIPPIPGLSIVRRPDNEHLTTVGEILHRQGFDTFFIYGGYGYFDNMNAFFAGNDYEVIDRTDFAAESVGFANIWGVADEFLYDNVLMRLDRSYASNKRFFAQIMTTSNHRPYTYPKGRIDIPPGVRSGAVKYTDYAIGHFIDQARTRPWFDDTLFVIVADHCASVAGKTQLPVPHYLIPLIFYAPALLKPGRNDRIASQIDIPPTLLDLLGMRGDDYFFGKSLFEQDDLAPRAFISNYQELGYLKNGRLIVLGPKKFVATYAIDAQGQATIVNDDAELIAEAVAYYQTAFHAFQQGEMKISNVFY